MKSEPSEVKAEQSIKNGFNFTSQRFHNKWRKLLKKIVTQQTAKGEQDSFLWDSHN